MVSIAVVNQKGGVGKTTVALGLASAASAAGLRVLVVDLDPQANASTGLGIWEPEITVDHALEQDAPGALVEVITASSWALPDAYPPEVAASSPQLAQREPQLANDPVGAQDRLQVALEGIDHDLVIIDCPPSLGLLTVNGLFAADQALVVTEPGAWASDGVEQILRTVNRIAGRRPGGLGVAGIVVNRLGRTRDAKYWYDQLVGTYADQVLPPVRLRAAIPEAAAQSRPIHGLGARPGAADAAAEFDALFAALFPELAVAPSTELVEAGVEGDGVEGDGVDGDGVDDVVEARATDGELRAVEQAGPDVPAGPERDLVVDVVADGAATQVLASAAEAPGSVPSSGGVDLTGGRAVGDAGWPA